MLKIAVRKYNECRDLYIYFYVPEVLLKEHLSVIEDKNMFRDYLTLRYFLRHVVSEYYAHYTTFTLL